MTAKLKPLIPLDSVEVIAHHRNDGICDVACVSRSRLWVSQKKKDSGECPSEVKRDACTMMLILAVCWQ